MGITKPNFNGNTDYKDWVRQRKKKLTQVRWKHQIKVSYMCLSNWISFCIILTSHLESVHNIILLFFFFLIDSSHQCPLLILLTAASQHRRSEVIWTHQKQMHLCYPFGCVQFPEIHDHQQRIFRILVCNPELHKWCILQLTSYHHCKTLIQ